jgi:outer membrane protein assembly factor BamB
MPRSALLLLLAGLGLGQSPHTSKVSVPDDPVVRQGLQRAEEALAQGDLDRHLRLLQDLLDRAALKVVEAERGPRSADTTDQVVPGDRFRGLPGEVRARLDAAPAEVRARYLELVEPKARAALEEALSADSENLLALVQARFALTSAGLRAAFALGDLWLARGRAEEALGLFRRLRGDHRSGEPGLAPILARVASALGALGDSSGLENLRAELSPEDLALELRVGGKTTTVDAYLAHVAARVPPPPPAPAPARELEVFRRRMWGEVFDVNTNRENSTYVFHSDFRDGDAVPYYPAVPVLREGKLFLASGLRIEAWNLLTAEPLWPAVTGPQTAFVGRRNHNLLFEPVVDRDLVVASLEGPPIRTGSRAALGFAPIEPIPSRRLVAVDVHTGQVRWSHFAPAGNSADDLRFLRELTVNQPPVARGETLFVTGSVYLGVFHQWLCAFERSSGRLRWRTYLGSGQMELNMFGNPVKEAVPGRLAEFDGVLYGATNVGTIFAVDAATGVIRWISAYHQEPIPGSDYTLTMERYPGWTPAAPARAAGRIFVAPQDSYHLYAADPATGALSIVPGASRTPETMNRHFLGVLAGHVLVAGRAITAFDPATLERRWRTAEIQTGRSRVHPVGGRPAADAENLFVLAASDATSALLVVDLRTGRFQKRQEIEAPGLAGNLVVAPEAMVVANEGGVSVFFDLNAVKRRFERLVAEDRGDPGNWAALGGVLVRQAQYGQALAAYQRSLESAEAQGPAGQDAARQARLALYNLWIDLARKVHVPVAGGPARPEDRFQKALEYAETAEQQVRALKAGWEWALTTRDAPGAARVAARLLAEFRHEPIDVDGALAALLPDLPPGARLPAGVVVPLVAAGAAIERRAPQEAVAALQRVLEGHPEAMIGAETAWTYAGRRIADLVARFGPACYREQEEAAAQLFAAASGEDGLTTLRSVLRRFPQSQAAPRAMLEISRRLLAGSRFREALVEIQRALMDFRRAEAQSLYEIARCLSELGATDSERQVLSSLGRRFPEAEVATGEGLARVPALLARRSPPAPAAAPSFAGPLKEAWRMDGADAAAPAEFLLPAKGRLLVHFRGEILALEPADGAVAWRRSCQDPPMRWFVHDGLAVGVMDGDLVALDAATGIERWRLRPSGNELLDLNVGHGRVYALVRDFTREIPVSIEVHELFGGELLRRILVPGARGSFAASRPLMVSPGYVLVRDDPGRIAVCFDAFTMEPVNVVTALRGDGTQILLTEQDLLLTVTASSRVLPALALSARPPAAREDTWVFNAGPGSMTLLALTRSHLVVQVVAVTRSRTGPEAATNRLVVVDLDRLGPARSIALRPGEFAIPPVQFARGRLYAQVRVTRSSLAERIRVFDLQNGQSPWSSVDFTGPNLVLSALATEEALLVRRVTADRNDPLGASGEAFLLQGDSGTVLERLGLGESPVGFGGQAFAVLDGTLFLNAGRAILGLRP